MRQPETWPRISSHPETHAIDNSLATGSKRVSSLQRSNPTSVLLQDQRDDNRVCAYSAYKPEGSRQTLWMPPCYSAMSTRVRKAKYSQKGRSACQHPLTGTWWESCLSKLVLSVLAWPVATDWCFIWRGLDWSKSRIGFLQEEDRPEPRFFLLVLGIQVILTWLVVGLLTVCPLWPLL